MDCENSEVNYLLEHVVDYYPYGKVLREHTNCEDARYLTTHHERDKETDLDYRGARFYDSDIGRFLSLDPLAADFAAWSPYNYVLGNPIVFVDPDGRAPVPPVKIIYWDYAVTAGINGVGGAGAKIQKGIAYDDYGVTLFEANNTFAFTGKGDAALDGNMPDNMVTGIDAGASVGGLIDNSSSTFEEYAAKHSTLSFSAGPGDIEIGDNTYGIDFAIGPGISMHKINLEVKESLSLTKSEFRNLGGLSTVLSTLISVGNVTSVLNDSGEVTGYKGEVIVHGLFNTRSTGITVSSGVNINKDGEVTSNEMWQSDDYRSKTQ